MPKSKIEIKNQPRNKDGGACVRLSVGNRPATNATLSKTRQPAHTPDWQREGRPTTRNSSSSPRVCLVHKETGTSDVTSPERRVNLKQVQELVVMTKQALVIMRLATQLQEPHDWIRLSVDLLPLPVLVKNVEPLRDRTLFLRG